MFLSVVFSLFSKTIFLTFILIAGVFGSMNAVNVNLSVCPF